MTESLESVRRRLGTIEDLGAVVRTMKALASVGMQQNEQAVRALARYADTVTLGLRAVLLDAEPVEAAREAPGKAAGIVVFGTDHGMCGRFNDDVAAAAVEFATPLRDAGGSVRVLAVGHRLEPLLAAGDLRAERTLPIPGTAPRITPAVRELLLGIDHWRDTGVGRVVLAYNSAVSRGRSRPRTESLLPVDLGQWKAPRAPAWPGRSRPGFSMTRAALLSALIRQHLFVTLFRACAESVASENAARLIAMQAAEKNLREREADLRAEFRRVRQDAITAELLDVIGGYEALRES